MSAEAPRTISIDELSARVAARGGPHAPYVPGPEPIKPDLVRLEREAARRAEGPRGARTHSDNSRMWS